MNNSLAHRINKLNPVGYNSWDREKVPCASLSISGKDYDGDSINLSLSGDDAVFAIKLIQKFASRSVQFNEAAEDATLDEVSTLIGGSDPE